MLYMHSTTQTHSLSHVHTYTDACFERAVKPVFTGPAIVSNFYPEEAFRTVDTEIIVQMTNLNKLNLSDAPR